MKLSIEQGLQQAVETHLAGKLQEAEALYRAILQIQPLHPHANHNLGLIAVAVGKLDAALILFKNALDADPKQQQFWISYIDILIKENLLDCAKKALKKGKKSGLVGNKVEALEAQLTLIALKQDNKFAKKIKKTSQINRKFIRQIRSPSQASIDCLLKFYQNGQYNDAEKLAISLTENYPSHPFGWKVLGAVLKHAGKILDSLNAYQKAVSLASEDSEAHSNLGVTLKELGRLDDAETSYRKAIALKPDFAEAHSNLGVTQKELGRLEDAETSYRKAIALKPDFAEAYCNLGITLQELGRPLDAETNCRIAISLKPSYSQAYFNLGITLQELGKLDEAVENYRKAIFLKPEFAESHNNLGIALQELGGLDDAEENYRKAIALKPDYAEAYSNLGIVLQEKNKFSQAFDAVINSINKKATAEAKKIFVELSGKIILESWDFALSEMVISALREPWGRPSDIILFACRMLKMDSEFKQFLDLSKFDASQSNYKNITNILSLKNNFKSSQLLCEMLTSTHLADAELEIFFTTLRQQLLKIEASVMLKDPGEGVITSLHCALAQQCFINEYIYYQTPEEITCSQQLRNKLEQAIQNGQSISAVLIINVACYFPLSLIRGANDLLHKNWHPDVAAVLKQQIQEPFEEIILQSSIPCLTSIENKVSIAVQSQYEINPYPRWVRLEKYSYKQYLNSYIQRKFPFVSFQHQVDDRSPEILVAGCGTGQHPIGTVQSIKDSKILAIDLSMASLAYAKRKTQELDIKSIEYAQADILKLAPLGRTFNVIESSGVLHHLENPFEGWDVLLSLLRPKGLMRLGFYSELARRDIIRLRNLISQDSIGYSLHDIRNYRRYLFDIKKSSDFGAATNSTDFFSTSACRDLLFHIQEHRLNLSTITEYLNKNNLNFLGFDIDRSVIRAYKKCFPNDLSATCLDNWCIFEKEYPDTFISMYQFWIQRN